MHHIDNMWVDLVVVVLAEGASTAVSLQFAREDRFYASAVKQRDIFFFASAQQARYPGLQRESLKETG